ncbi:MAG: hypothetical protein KF884_00515 [Fimbriimonadaceae bacterium]|nr:hypothetical protein [Fimbriimonadaceae bacterium]QYK58578.1 MAG: hypothetical protein KF884_00515 [Fimbriimonadaceae bacterium]
MKSRAEWGARALALFGATTAVWLTVAGLAILVARRARQEFLEQSQENLKTLMEESLKDHGRDR